jgi:hypothetical protein
MIKFNSGSELKEYVKEQLSNTDYAVLEDVKLINKDEFISYRARLRSLYLNPILTASIPEEPQAKWTE